MLNHNETCMALNSTNSLKIQQLIHASFILHQQVRMSAGRAQKVRIAQAWLRATLSTWAHQNTAKGMNQ